MKNNFRNDFFCYFPENYSRRVCKSLNSGLMSQGSWLEAVKKRLNIFTNRCLLCKLISCTPDRDI